MMKHKSGGRLDRDAVISEMVAAVTYARSQGAKTVGVNAEDASRTDLGYLVDFGEAAKDAGLRIRSVDLPIAASLQSLIDPERQE